VTRAEFDALIKVLDERGDIINELRREVRETCRDLSEDVRRELQTQFTRIAQIQQEIDELKRKNGR
jgi:BMFP domain-containing protein YqiC